MAQYNHHTGGQHEGYNSSNNMAGNSIAHGGISGNGSIGGGSGGGGGGGGNNSSIQYNAGVNNHHMYTSRDAAAMNAMQGGIGKISDYDPLTDGPRNIPNTTRSSSTLIYSSDRGGMGKL